MEFSKKNFYFSGGNFPSSENFLTFREMEPSSPKIANFLIFEEGTCKASKTKNFRRELAKPGKRGKISYFSGTGSF